MVRLAVVVGDNKLRQEMVHQLEDCGFETSSVADGNDLWRDLSDADCDLVIVDSHLPGGDGYRISSRLRDGQPVGVILLGQPGSVEDRIRGFRAGADLYLAKPVDYRELAAAAGNLARRIIPLRRADAAVPARDKEWRLDEVKWELAAPDGRSVRLTGGEYRFLACLMARPGHAVSRADIIRGLGYSAVDYDPRSLDAVVRRMRRKAEAALGCGLPLRAAHSLGYVFTAPVVGR